jgi:exopolysaccharide biosynthesis polyprenyl glycosylphosphotransferase
VKSCYATIEQVIATCERVGVQASYPVDCFQCTVSSPRYEDVMDQGVVHMEMAPTDWRRVVKRLVDLVVASAGLVVIAPLLAVIGVAIKLTSRGPVLFRQRRYGYRRRPFIMYKFRTMRRDAEALQGGLESANEASGPVFKIRDDPRITRLGRLLRRSSLDELPQLFNVVRGDMALVGPRPMAFRDVHLFSEAWLLRRFSMPPGITGLWQVSGRSELGFDQWIQLDLHYIDHWSLRLDFRILARTLPAVICGRGAT